MTTILRFEGIKALPVFGSSAAKHRAFFEAALEHVREGNFQHLDIDYSMQDDFVFDEKEKDTALFIEVNHFNHYYPSGGVQKSMITVLTLLSGTSIH